MKRLNHNFITNIAPYFCFLMLDAFFEFRRAVLENVECVRNEGIEGSCSFTRDFSDFNEEVRKLRGQVVIKVPINKNGYFGFE